MTSVTAQSAGRAQARALPGLASDLIALALVGVALLARPDNALTAWPLLAYVMLWPGDLLRRATGVTVRDFGTRIVYALGSSLVLLIAATLVVESLGLVLGLGRPFAYAPLAWGVFSSAGLLVAAGNRPGAASAGPWQPQARVWVLAVAAAAPLLAMAGAKWVDAGRGPGLSLAAFAVLAAAVVVTLCRRSGADSRQTGDLVALVFGLGLAVAWSFSMRTPYLFGFDVHQELSTVLRTLGASDWRPRDGDAYNASLSVSSVPAALVTLSGIAPVVLLKVAYPVMLASLPAVSLLVLRRFLAPLAAVAFTVLFALTPVGFWQVAVISRQEMAFAVFGALLLLLLDGESKRGPRLALASVLGIGLVLTHYSTSYVAIGLLLAASVLTLVAARWMRLERSSTAIPLWLPLSMLVAAFLWGNVLNQSTQNVDSTFKQSVAASGLRQNDSFVDTWLKGSLSSASATPSQLFAAAGPVAAERPWLNAYSERVQSTFPATAAQAPSADALAPSLSGPSGLGYTVMRQLANLAVGLSALMLAWLVVRRRRLGRDDLPIVGLVGATLAISLAVRVNVGLASAYNAERLVVQLAPLYGLTLALGWRLIRPKRKRSRATTPVLGAVLGVVLLAALVDSTGARGLVTGATAGNLRSDDEYALRYRETTQDDAASSWLTERFGATNQVYTDRYGALLLRDRPSMDHGVLDALVPKLIDQRAYVFATTENVRGGRARSQIAGLQATYKFPTSFFNTYKTLAYDNGSSRVYN